MKSGRQRRDEIVERRRVRARIAKRTSFAPWLEPDQIPPGAILADQSQLLHDNTYGARPRYYADAAFTCVECGVVEVWTAAQQQWWYEVAKGKIDSRANRCHDCRRRQRLRRSQERGIHIDGLIARHGIVVAARKLSLSVEALERMRARWRGE